MDVYQHLTETESRKLPGSISELDVNQHITGTVNHGSYLQESSNWSWTSASRELPGNIYELDVDSVRVLENPCGGEFTACIEDPWGEGEVTACVENPCGMGSYCVCSGPLLRGKFCVC